MKINNVDDLNIKLGQIEALLHLLDEANDADTLDSRNASYLILTLKELVKKAFKLSGKIWDDTQIPSQEVQTHTH